MTATPQLGLSPFLPSQPRHVKSLSSRLTFGAHSWHWRHARSDHLPLPVITILSSLPLSGWTMLPSPHASHEPCLMQWLEVLWQSDAEDPPVRNVCQLRAYAEQVWTAAVLRSQSVPQMISVAFSYWDRQAGSLVSLLLEDGGDITCVVARVEATLWADSLGEACAKQQLADVGRCPIAAQLSQLFNPFFATGKALNLKPSGRLLPFLARLWASCCSRGVFALEWSGA